MRACSPVLSQWLDEIMGLMVVRGAGMRERLAGMGVNSGNAPLNYIIQLGKPDIKRAEFNTARRASRTTCGM